MFSTNDPLLVYRYMRLLLLVYYKLINGEVKYIEAEELNDVDDLTEKAFAMLGYHDGNAGAFPLGILTNGRGIVVMEICGVQLMYSVNFKNFIGEYDVRTFADTVDQLSPTCNIFRYIHDIMSADASNFPGPSVSGKRAYELNKLLVQRHEAIQTTDYTWLVILHNRRFLIVYYKETDEVRLIKSREHWD